LPILPALAASTPFLDGRNTGFADARIDVYAGNQRHVPQITGRVIPEPVRSEAQYSQVILEPMFRAIAPHDTDNILQFEWLNSRGAIARFDRHTIEIRVLDAQEHPGADLAIAQLVVATVKRLYRGADALLDAADALDTDELAAILRQCVKHGEAARLDNTEYLRVLGVPGVQTAGEAWRTLATMSRGKLVSHREALDVILNEGTLSTRLLRSVGQTVNAASLLSTYRRLCDCLAEGRMFHAGG